MTRLTAVDAQTFWLSAKIPSDQFLLYAFDGVAEDIDGVLAELRRRASECPDLRLRIVDDHRWRYPRWVDATVDRDQFVVHLSAGMDWAGCLDAVAALVGDQLDPQIRAWRLHVFTAVASVPGACGPATVAVLQIPHALADGVRASELAAWLFGRGRAVAPIAAPASIPGGSLLLRSVAAARAHRRLTRDLAAGRVPPAPPSRPALLTNAVPVGPRRVRILVRKRSALAGDDPATTVTVAALLAIGSALASYIAERGEDPGLLGAEVPAGKPGIRQARNHFRNIGISLRPELQRVDRVAAIEAQFAAARIRAEHPAQLTAGHSFAAVPAALLRWGVAQFDATARGPVVTGNTVVSSVNRGAADLHFGTAAVLLTAGFPALSPMMAVTHGVHGIGDTVAVSVHTAGDVIDLDDYLALSLIHI